MPAEIRVASNQGEVIVFGPRRITLGAGSVDLRNIVRSLNTAGFNRISIDMTETDYVDSSGIGELVYAFTYTKNAGGSFRLNGVPRGVHDLLQITKLYTVFEVAKNDWRGLPSITVHTNDVSSLRAANALPIFLTLRDNHIRVDLGVSDSVYKVRADGTSPSIIIAGPHGLFGGQRTVAYADLKEFEELINSAATREEDIHRFLEAHQAFLLGHEYRKLHSKVFLEREGDGPLIPDFLLQPFDEELCDVLDLKLPREPIVVGSHNRRRLSGAIHEAVAQLRTYRGYFDDRRQREAVFSRYGVKAYRPRLSVIIGRMNGVDPLEYRFLSGELQDVRIVTYDDLLKRVRRFLVV